jgi:hypothetical protein
LTADGSLMRSRRFEKIKITGCAGNLPNCSLGHPAKSGGLRGVASLEVPRGNLVVRVGGKGE